MPRTCPICATALPTRRAPANRHQALNGGWTCSGCGTELDAHARPREAVVDLGDRLAFTTPRPLPPSVYGLPVATGLAAVALAIGAVQQGVVAPHVAVLAAVGVPLATWMVAFLVHSTRPPHTLVVDGSSVRIGDWKVPYAHVVALEDRRITTDTDVLAVPWVSEAGWNALIDAHTRFRARQEASADTAAARRELDALRVAGDQEPTG